MSTHGKVHVMYACCVYECMELLLLFYCGLVSAGMDDIAACRRLMVMLLMC
jgi:hypothetical protein